MFDGGHRLHWTTHAHEYQNAAAAHLFERDAAALWLDPGYGKTMAVLHAFQALREAGLAENMLVVAPLRVVQTVWAQEIENWASLDGLRAARLHGPKKEGQLRRRDVNVWLINYEGIPWLAEQAKKGRIAQKFDVVVADEVRRFKNSQGKRFKAARPLFKTADYRWGLTGTPASNGLLDLFGQFLILDDGAALGRTLTRFRTEYFEQGFDGFSYVPRPGAWEKIEERIAPYVFRTHGKLDLPDFVEDTRKITLTDKARKTYKKLKSDMIAEVEDTPITAANAAVLLGKLKQLANGRIYDETRKVHKIHDAKADALRELVEELGDEQLLIAYEYNHDLAQIKEVLGDDLPYLGAGVNETTALRYVDAWNRGEITHMAAHPACLHPDTLVLTEYRGWVRLIDVHADDRVFDGMEFVSHRGCQLSGVREVISRFGVTMTPDHPILVNDEWVEAGDVPDTADARREARYTYAGDDSRLGMLLDMRGREYAIGAECAASQQGGSGTLLCLPGRDVPQDGVHAPLQDMAGGAGPGGEPVVPGLEELRRTGDSDGPLLVGLPDVLEGYAGGVRGRSDNRPDRRERPLRGVELPVGAKHGAAGQQAEQPAGGVPGRDDAPGRVLSSGGRDTRRDHEVPGPARDRRRGDGGVPRQSVSAVQEIPVYDLVDCGPRHRFAVCNAAGEVFIVHNSAGHGLNLQKSGAHHVLWWGPTFDLDHFIQFNDRLRRQGNEASAVVVHTFVTEGSVDEIAVTARTEKASLQDTVLLALTTEEKNRITTDTDSKGTTMTELQFRSDAQQQPQGQAPNPFGGQPQQDAQPPQGGFGQQPQGQAPNPFAQPQQAAQPQQEPSQPANPFAGQQQPQPQGQAPNPFDGQGQPAQQPANPFAGQQPQAPNPADQQQAIQQAAGGNPPPTPNQAFAAHGVATGADNPAQPQQEAPQQPPAQPQGAQPPNPFEQPQQGAQAPVQDTGWQAPPAQQVEDAQVVQESGPEAAAQMVGQTAAAPVAGMVPLYTMVPADKLEKVLSAIGRAVK